MSNTTPVSGEDFLTVGASDQINLNKRRLAEFEANLANQLEQLKVAERTANEHAVEAEKKEIKRLRAGIAVALETLEELGVSAADLKKERATDED